jgi:hypothetical protein
LREKWRSQNAIYRTSRFAVPLPSFVFDLFPHRWNDPGFFEDLDVYDGPFIRAVLENPREFVRDGLQTYEEVRKRKFQRSTAGG